MLSLTSKKPDNAKNDKMDKRVTGIGGVFFKTKDPGKLRSWYQRHLGIEPQPYGGSHFEWRELDDPETKGRTVWSPFPEDTDYFAPSTAPFMINYRVADLRALVVQLREEGLDVTDVEEHPPAGLFAWVSDPEGNRLELWEQVDYDD